MMITTTVTAKIIIFYHHHYFVVAIIIITGICENPYEGILVRHNLLSLHPRHCIRCPH